MSQDISYALEATEVLKRMQRWQEVTGVETSKLLRDEMRLIVTRLMQAYAPYKTILATSFAGQIAVGKAAVARDVSKVFVSSTDVFKSLQTGPDSGAAKAFYRAYQRGEYGEATRILRASKGPYRNVEHIGGAPKPEVHRKARDPRGRVRRHRPLQVVSARDKREYTREIQRRVGWAKAGWLNAATRLNAKGIPLAIRNLSAAPGHLIDAAAKPLNPTIEAQNFVKYVRQLDPGNRLLSQILKARAKAYERRTEAMLQRGWGKK